MTTTTRSASRPSFAPLLLLVSLLALGCAGETSPTSPDPSGGEVVSVSVEPASVEGWTGDTVRLRATALDAAGQPVDDAAVEWSIDDPAVAAVSSDGLVTVRATVDTATLSADLQGQPGVSASVSVRGRGSRPDTVVVSPGSASVASGGEVTLEAAVRDASGEPKQMQVAWSSSDTAVATVSENGVVTARAGGTAVVTAEAGPAAGTSEITVSGSGDGSDDGSGSSSGDDSGSDDGSGTDGASGAGAAECEDPDSAWIWCDDFDRDRTGSYFEYDDDGGDFVRRSGVGRDGSTAMRTGFQAGEVSAGYLHLAFGRTPSTYFDPVDAGSNDYREIYWRVYVRNEAGWSGGGGHKLSRATVFATSEWAQAMAAYVWSGGEVDERDHLLVDPVSGTDESGVLQTTQYNDSENQRWLGSDLGTLPLFDGDHVGEWYCVEVHVRLNDAGHSNGVFEMWIDGVKDAERTGLNWVGSYDDYGLNAVFLENYWNGSGSTQAQERYFDNFVVSTERIGC